LNAHAITSKSGCRQSFFDCDFDRPSCSGPDNSAIRFPGIEIGAALIGAQFTWAVIAALPYFVSNPGGVSEISKVMRFRQCFSLIL